MILLKANPEIKTVFLKMIKTMGENVKWTEIFVINNNDIILAGNGRSLFFNFDNRRAFSNIVDLPINENRVEPIIQNTLLVNALNMILYAFGKWGEIKGLKVETEYNQLNKLMNNILDEIDIEANLTKDNFRFYKNGIQITYEEVVQAILDKTKPVEEVPEEESEENGEEDKEAELEPSQDDINNKYKIGLWHNMRWTDGNFTFKKEELTEHDQAKSRLGNDFYMVNYKCPSCEEKLYMVIYPLGKEFRIETGGEAVYMSRAYTCSQCNCIYTPKPHKLIMEGDVYHLPFEDDKAAYEDYLELLGRQGERTSNSNFNKYESEYKGKMQEESPLLEELCNEMETMSDDEIVELKDKMDSGFFPQRSVEKNNKKVEKELKRRKNKRSKEKEKEPKEKMADSSSPTKTSKQKQIPGFTNKSATQNAPRFHMGKTEKVLHMEKIEKESNVKSEQEPLYEMESVKTKIQNQERTNFNRSETDLNSNVLGGLSEIMASLLKGEHDFFAGALEKLSQKHLDNLKIMIQSEQGIQEQEKKNYIDIIDQVLHKEKEKDLIQKYIPSKEKSYTEIQQLINEIKLEDTLDSVKRPVLESLMDLLKKRGEKELDNIISHIPEPVSRKQYKQLVEKMEQYKEIDSSLHIKRLDEKRDAVEKQEIAAFIKRANANDSKSMYELYQKLKEMDFDERNVSSYLEKIHDRIYALDEAAIKRICPDPADITFEEGLEAYEEISLGNFLPELKVNILGMIEKRLMKMKMDECEQLVKKLSKDMKWVEGTESRIHFYDTRKMMRGDATDNETQIIQNALTAYASSRGKYEYPIVIGDTSRAGNGRTGFVLTPDHIFYNGFVTAGEMDITDIETISAGTGLFSKGIYISKNNTGKVKISNSLKAKDIKSFAKALNDFVNYLKEKPESRSVSYMAKEKHAVKCCYRCGYVYKGGNICPKCGGKFNN